MLPTNGSLPKAKPGNCYAISAGNTALPGNGTARAEKPGWFVLLTANQAFPVGGPPGSSAPGAFSPLRTNTQAASPNAKGAIGPLSAGDSMAAQGGLR